jgi:hypothetical protein
MKSVSLTAVALALSASSVIAQTADHAPTKPAADAAAKYDRELKQTGPANAGQGAGNSSSGASTGSGLEATRNKTGPADRGTTAPRPKNDKSR